MKYCITHPGRAHRDEFYCCGLITYLFGVALDIFRREPTPEEMADPEVLVFDVGRVYNPELMKFDHHQFEAGVEDCALSLMAEHFKVYIQGVCHSVAELWRDTPWYKGVVLQDSLGLPGMAKRLELPSIPEELVSGIEIFCLQEFSSFDRVPMTWKTFALELVTAKIRTAIEFQSAIDTISKNHEVREVENVGKVFWAPELGPFALNKYIQREGLQVVATVTKDPRGGGLCLYRIGEFLDFTRVGRNPWVGFAHSGGYMCTLEPGATWEKVKELIAVAAGKKCRLCGDDRIGPDLWCPRCGST